MKEKNTLEVRSGRLVHVVEVGPLTVIVDVTKCVQEGMSREDVATFVDELLRVSVQRWKERRG